MSRIGKQPVPVPSGVTVTLSKGTVKVSGSRGDLEHELPDCISVTQDGDVMIVARDNESRSARSLHGLTRSLINNMVVGVVRGFTKQLQIIGVGYRAKVEGKNLSINLGFSHPVIYPIPEDVTVTVENNTLITVEGNDKQRVGQAAAEIRRFRKPEPYKGKGIRYLGEYVMQKVGKTV